MSIYDPGEVDENGEPLDQQKAAASRVSDGEAPVGLIAVLIIVADFLCFIFGV